jgi:DNA-binding NarL/FixJ family response regulator
MVPVIVLTSSHQEKDVLRSYRLGVNAYVVKPVDFHEFVNAVKELGVFWAVIKSHHRAAFAAYPVDSGSSICSV